jgi:hypothetical protein
MAPRKLQMPMRGQDVTLLHALLNYHMPPPDDQLPVAGPGALDFGPRTLAKVKKFQEINKIDFGTKYFMDGVVGPNTWAALTKTQQVTVTVTPAAPSGLERAIERHFQPSARLTPPALILPQSNPPLASKGSYSTASRCKPAARARCLSRCIGTKERAHSSCRSWR